jgi:putative heme-binding domain-containing protein
MLVRTCVALFTGCAAVSLVFASAEGAEVFTQQPEVQPAQTAAGDTVTAAITTSPRHDGSGDVDLAKGPQAEWIWGSAQSGDKDRYVFRYEFEADATDARLIATCDNVMTVLVNGKRVAASSEWGSPVVVNVQKQMKKGKNELRVEAANQGGQAGLALKLGFQGADGKAHYVVTDKAWRAAANAKSTDWSPVHVLGKMGMAPWSHVFANPATGKLPNVERGVFTVLPGFQVELLYTVPKDTQGSWVSIAFDKKGRLIASDQGNRGLFRITPPAIGGTEPTKVEPLDAKITSAQGMLAAFDSLYISVNGGPGSGLYRARDTNGDDQYDEVKLLKTIAGGGEHGPHALRLSPDGKSIFIIAGNHTDLPKDIVASRAPTNWSEDLLLPRQWDARGHARGKLAPGGWICKVDPDGENWEVFSNGYRNAYDMDFNADGELFAYDADMEWDMGTPWYRPTRAVHATSGSEFGWRSGTGKWPTYYVDSLPPLVDIGPGSPVGVAFGTGAKFPAKHQQALYLLDWTFGTIHVVHPTPDGASYKATKEEFLSRSPLPLTDVAIGPDGAMYFTIGGRGTNSALFRVTYVGDESTAPVDGRNQEGAELRALRRKLEAFHTDPNPQAVETLWPYLGHEDRHIRFAARIALEHQDPATWSKRALAEKDPRAQIVALAALARQGDKSLQSQALQALGAIDYSALDEAGQLDLLRAYQLVLVRMGEPDIRTKQQIAARLDEFYPAASDGLNRELSRVLVYVNSPTVISKTLELMANPREQSPEFTADLIARNGGYGGTIAKMLANLPEIQNIHYAFVLRNMRYGWTLEQRKKYFEWLNAALSRSGGASYQGFITNIRKEALDNLSPAERQALESEVAAAPPKPGELPKPQGPGQEWTTSEVASLASDGLVNRNFERGKTAFAAARCVVCHRFDGAGGATGPDLSNVAGRFSPRDLAEALVEPSKVVSDQYRGSKILTLSGKVYSGRIVGEADGALTVMIDPEDATKIVTVAKDDIDEVTPSKVSLMPEKSLNPLSRDEVLDLLAYLYSRGNPHDPMFAVEK